jgi:hypothetical protein
MPGEEAEQRVEQQGERDRRDGIATSPPPASA